MLNVCMWCEERAVIPNCDYSVRLNYSLLGIVTINFVLNVFRNVKKRAISAPCYLVRLNNAHTVHTYTKEMNFASRVFIHRHINRILEFVCIYIYSFIIKLCLKFPYFKQCSECDLHRVRNKKKICATPNPYSLCSNMLLRTISSDLVYSSQQLLL